MNVKIHLLLLNAMKSRFVISVISLSAVILISSAFLIMQKPQEEFLDERAGLVVRQIGHKLLQHSGDSTSRVMPVRKLNPGTFQLEFQNHFSFMPDTLVKIVTSNLSLINLPVGYIVNVFNCTSNEVVYGFEISPMYKEIVPCLGREQPTGCYNIQISFVDSQSSQNLHNYFPIYASALICLGLVAFGATQLIKNQREENSIEHDDSISIGKYLFSLRRQSLYFKSETIELSNKEAKLLSILAARINHLISREELLQKVWEDDGVFTGRSLDMFISKLRKKLKADPCVQITNVHGKGYKLEFKPENLK